MNSTAVKFAPAVADDRRIDVAIEGGDAVFQLSEWVDGLGWCTQKTMRFDETLLEEMHRLVSAARVRVRNSRPESEPVSAPSNVLKFPASL